MPHCLRIIIGIILVRKKPYELSVLLLAALLAALLSNVMALNGLAVNGLAVNGVAVNGVACEASGGTGLAQPADGLCRPVVEPSTGGLNRGFNQGFD